MRLIYFSPVAWDSYEQRPHYFVRYFLETGGHAVLWINPYAARLPRWSDVARADPAGPLTLPRLAGVTVVDVGGWPIDPIPGGSWLNEQIFWHRAIDRLAGFASTADTIVGIGRPTALARTALRSLHKAWSFYDAMDDFPEFYGGLSRQSTRRIEEAIAADVDQIYTASARLERKFTVTGRTVVHVPNAYDMALLPPVAEHRARPARLGFIGCMGRWFDWRLVVQLAEAVDPVPVTLIGPRPAFVPGRLPRNIECRPPCHQSEGVADLLSFSAGLIPFKRTRLTAGIDPIKYYQYRGAGLPVLTTRFGEMACRTRADGTFFLDDRVEMESAVTAALAFRPTVESVARFRAANTWAERFKAADIFRRRGGL